MQVTIKPGRMVDGRFVAHEGPGPVTPWWWQVDDDCAVYSGSCPTETEAWCQASVALGWAPPPMVGRVEGVTARLSALQARAEAAEARAAQAEADARLMLTALVDLDESVGTNVVMCWRGLGLTDAECDALWSRFARTSTEVEQRELEALRRILATAGAT